MGEWCLEGLPQRRPEPAGPFTPINRPQVKRDWLQWARGAGLLDDFYRISSTAHTRPFSPTGGLLGCCYRGLCVRERRKQPSRPAWYTARAVSGRAGAPRLFFMYMNREKFQKNKQKKQNPPQEQKGPFCRCLPPFKKHKNHNRIAKKAHHPDCAPPCQV